VRVVLDTNVVVSGLFFSGPPSVILEEVFSGRVAIVMTDDKFFECAVAGKAKLIVSGDRHLLDASGTFDVEVLPPRAFVDNYLQG